MNYLNIKLYQLSTAALALFFCVSLTACDQTASIENNNISWQRIEFNYGKPAAPVILEYALPEMVSAGDNFALTLRFSSSTTAGRLSADFSTEGPLQLNSANSAEFSLQDEEKRVELTVTALEDALAYINVSVGETDENGVALLGRSFSIPIQVGPVLPAAKQLKGLPNGQKLKQDGDELIIEMTAEQR